MSLRNRFFAGIFTENPVFRLAIGLVPAVGITHLALNGLYIGILTTLVLIGALGIKAALGWFISRDLQPYVDWASLIILTAVFYRILGVTHPDLVAQLGIYFFLIAFNGLIFQQLFSNQGPLSRLVGSAGMGIGYTLALTGIGALREFVGLGQIFGTSVLRGSLAPFSLAATVPGGFIIVGLLIAVFNVLSGKEAGTDG